MSDPKELNDSFVAWTKSIAELTDGEVVAVDGKCLRGSSDEGTGTYIHLVSAWASANNLLLAQEKVAGKSNEITAIPRMLRILELKNCIPTIDAMGCQREIAGTIIDRGADYILALKANQTEMLDRLSKSFTYIKPSSVHTMEDKSHGRQESRTCSVITNLENIIDRDRSPGLRSIVRIESRTREIKTGEVHKETRFYISSGKPKPGCPLRPGLFDPMSQNCSNPFTQNKNDPCRQNVSAGDFICIFGFRFGRRGIKPKKHEYKIKKHSLVSRIGNGNKKHQQCF